MAEKKLFAVMPLRQVLHTDTDRLNYVVDALHVAAIHLIHSDDVGGGHGELVLKRLRRALEAINQFGRKEPTR